ncbi:MAG: nitroreductase family protein [Desulfovibrio sp.]|nr:nitroreductase family protein [Desulfovibrio sp.]
MKLNFIVDAEKCIQCDACVQDCPHGIIRINRQYPEVTEDLEDDCLQCQHCLAVCPPGAISIFGLKPGDSLSLVSGALPSQLQMKTLVRGRRSVRQFLDENISAHCIDELLADIAHAPTGCNDRGLIFSVIDDRVVMQKLREKIVAVLEERQKADASIPVFLADAIAGYRNDGRDDFFRGAPHLLVVSAKNKATCGVEDVIIALSYFELLAQSAGIGTTWCGMLKFVIEAAPELRAPLGLDANAPFYAMMFGQPDVRYARTVQRDTAAEIRRIRCS